MGVSVGDFGFFLDVGDGVGRLLGSFTIVDALVLSVFLCLTSTLVCSVFLLGASFGVVFC